LHDYAGATLDELYGGDALKAMVRLEAAHSDSGVLINDGTGRFTFSPFADEAQLGAIVGLVSGDLDGDGDLDLVAADGFGTVLLGDGKGGFSAESPRGTGGAGAIGVGLTDIDGDGIVDVLWPMGGGEVRWQRGL
jgi:hypothetical protein